MLIDNFFITFIIILFVFKLKKDKITIFIAIILNLSHIRLHKYFYYLCSLITIKNKTGMEKEIYTGKLLKFILILLTTIGS